MSTMQPQIIPSGRGRSAQRASAVTWIAMIVLAVFALLGANFAVLALIALAVLGSILILFDRSLDIDPHDLVT